MFIGIGTLIFAKHPALRSLAAVTIIGMFTVVLMAYYLPPLVFRWLTRGVRTADPSSLTSHVSSPLPITLGRFLRSLFSIVFFLLMMYLFMLPFTWLYFHIGKNTEEKKLRYHRLLQKVSDFVIHRVPGVKFHLENRVGETFEKPAVIICNHQSHLDLMCLMMLTPRIVFLTNDWVWHNPFYGMVIHRAEFYPVSDGIENHIDQLKSLYNRGYSIAVFPEGTRSVDCSIQRFHKGAFYLAEQLQADILPMVWDEVDAHGSPVFPQHFRRHLVPAQVAVGHESGGTALRVDGVAIAGELDGLLNVSQLQVALRNQETTIAVEREQLNLRNKLTENLLVLLVVAIQPRAHQVHLLVPDAFGIEYQTVLEHVLAQHQVFLARCL